MAKPSEKFIVRLISNAGASRAGVLLAGPLTDQVGSLIVIETNSLEEAEQFAQEDPYTMFGVFERVGVHPFLQVFPADQNRF